MAVSASRKKLAICESVSRGSKKAQVCTSLFIYIFILLSQFFVFLCFRGVYEFTNVTSSLRAYIDAESAIHVSKYTHIYIRIYILRIDNPD